MNKHLHRALLAGFSWTLLTQGSFAGPAQEIKVNSAQQSVQGRPIPVYRYGTGSNEYIFLFGVFHGDEPQGAFILRQLMGLLDQNPAYYLDKSIFVVPVVNPDGLQHKTRINARKVDLNRNFPTKDFKPNLNRGSRYFAGAKALSEPESQLVYDLLKPYVEDSKQNKIKILSIHAPLAVNNYDGPAASLAERLKLYNSYPISSDIGYSTPGSFGTYYGKERGLSVLTLETSKESPQAAWQRHQKALLALLQYPDTNLYPQMPLPSPTPEPTAQPSLTPEPSPTADPTAQPSTQPSAVVKPWWPLRPAPVLSPEPTLPTLVPTPMPSPQATALPSVVPTPAPSPVPTPTPYQPGKVKLPSLSKQVVLQVSKKTQLLKVKDQGKLLASFPVSTGLGPKDTPLGTFKILTKVPFPAYNGSLHRGKRYYAPKDPHNPLGSRWMQINAWHYRTRAMLGIHGTDEPLGIGQAVSGGCVRMHNADVERLFEALPLGAKVVISD